jgi:hypothetical protein
MECLPNELFYVIFSYLHKIDLVYAFINLNQRFQRLIMPYLDESDFTQSNISFRHFQILRVRVWVRHSRQLSHSRRTCNFCRRKWVLVARKWLYIIKGTIFKKLNHFFENKYFGENHVRGNPATFFRKNCFVRKYILPHNIRCSFTRWFRISS